MGRAKLTADWDRQAPLLALIYETNRRLAALAKCKIPQARSSAEFHPLRGATTRPARPDEGLPKLPVTVLKKIFCRER